MTHRLAISFLSYLALSGVCFAHGLGSDFSLKFPLFCADSVRRHSDWGVSSRASGLGGDFDFFVIHTDEKERLLDHLEALIRKRHQQPLVRFLDVGCASGDLAESLVKRKALRAGKTHFTIVEPNDDYRSAAVRNLTALSAGAVQAYEITPTFFQHQFDIILASHVLYYVRDLVLPVLWEHLRPGGTFMISISNEHSDFTKLDREYHRGMGASFEYRTVRDVEAFLSQFQLDYELQRINSSLRFKDTPENRRKILRMHLGGTYEPSTEARLFALLNKFKDRDYIQMTLRDNLYHLVKPR